ncbi:Fanconi anemia group J protein homolog isoform X2 [Centruroides sculpturatus]|nr:Fanconi anemia group J protein homolog isoform X2 [Centruroides sculpturatus]XP_023215128.1 Fanconi anemia group J protein homolog isoform X2 [Centruroides sculpturatus]XP_023215129.1 Fanconi anemia group J protein homolog isoform X2 [Centruroides sculpturatus]XP_023215130.1 Fanconi anemia group J protein homolog isoform X2 [Centruroides sculpturatus]
MESVSTPGENEERSYCIQRVPLVFPCKAYPAQLAIMDKIIKGLTRRQNCLIESPTGTGKSLALLISCLAWQRSLANENTSEDLGNSTVETATPSNLVVNKSIYKLEEDVDNDFQPQKRYRSTNVQNGTMDSSEVCIALEVKTTKGTKSYLLNTSDSSSVLLHKPQRVAILPLYDFSCVELDRKGENGSPEIDENLLKARMTFDDGTFCEYLLTCLESYKDVRTKLVVINAENGFENDFSDFSSLQSSPEDPNSSQKKKIPQIYFGTRTHKQITQIVQELRKTIYKDVRMCILSSRDRTCIHKTVSMSCDKNKGCKELLDELHGFGCEYFRNSQALQYDSLKSHGLQGCWDLEDLVKVGKKMKACPYFGLRNLLPTADIIFCPYNYIIDPLIRESMEINLKNNILILDEAHNIEDSAREAASFDISKDELDAALLDIDNLGYLGCRTFSHGVVAGVLAGLRTWIGNNANKLFDYSDFSRTGKVWSGEELVAMLSEIKAGPEDYEFNRRHFTISCSEDRSEKNYKKPSLNNATTNLVSSLLLMFEFLYSHQLLFMSDYRAVIVRELGYTRLPSVDFEESSSSQFMSEHGFVSKNSKGWTYSLKIWCLNPAVAFSKFKDEIHSIVVSSGTLSPMMTFQSELEVEFPISLEANHIVSKSQIWVGSIGCGPTGTQLKAVYNQTDTFAFQDELGRVVLNICQIVPCGVLCFFASYSMMEKLTNRWKLTGMWEQIEVVKKIVSESKKNDKRNFEEIMTEFYDNVTDENVNGSIFFAVFRGKVSEGLNFSDNYARAVISVGIPFPNVKDIQIDLKKKYNDKHCVQKHLMSGKDWYETQAFRALNQALGRCIRHKNDWGALVLVDQRFSSEFYTRGLSKWIRGYVVHHQTFGSAAHSLREFVTNRMSSSE